YRRFSRLEPRSGDDRGRAESRDRPQRAHDQTLAQGQRSRSEPPNARPPDDQRTTARITRYHAGCASDPIGGMRPYRGNDRKGQDMAEFEEVNVLRKDAPDVVFEGKLIAEADSRAEAQA